MPNNLPPCPACGGRKRHRPENCPTLRSQNAGPTDGIQGIPNNIRGMILSLRHSREAIDRVLKEFGVE